MARPLRIEAAGMWYHVMSRGDDRRAVFFEDADYELFLNKLADSCVLYHVELHAYALMQNHVHLYLHTQEANLGRFMQRLLTAFSIALNLKHERCGHVFQGRYKAIVVEQTAYGNEVSRYIHLNPMVTGNASKELEKQRRAVRSYRWSSYGAMIGIAAAHPALVRADTLGRFEGSRSEQAKAYAAFVEEGLLKNIEDPVALAKGQLVLGKDSFVDKILRLLRGRTEKDGQAEQSRRRLVSVSIGTVKKVVAQAYRVTVQGIEKKGSHGNEARHAAIWLASKACIGGMSLKAIGASFGLSASRVLHVRDLMAERGRKDRRWRCRLDMLLQKAIGNA